MTCHIIEPKSAKEALSSEHSVQWKNATSSEYSSLIKNDTWELVPPPDDKNIVGSKWVLKVKRNADGTVDRLKARLVAQGYSQTHGIGYDEVFSPVAKYSAIRSLLALAKTHNREVHQMDVKTAFLIGSIDSDIYMSQPEGFIDPDRPIMCKLNESIYSLKQSAHCWNTTLDEFLTSTGYRKGKADDYIYIKQMKNSDGKVNFVILTVYVDDMIPVSNDINFRNAEKASLCKRFEIIDQGEAHFILGMSVRRDRKNQTLSIGQPRYVKSILKQFGMENCKAISTLLEAGKKFQTMSDDDEQFNVQVYQQVVGCLTYLSTAT